jgi:raffinose/stachyose/melibiose transport system permease protein
MTGVNLTVGSGTNSRSQRTASWIRRVRARVLARLVLSVVGLVWIMPILYLVNVSLRGPNELFDSSPLIFHGLTTINFTTVIAQNPLAHYFVNTALIATTSTLLVVAGAAAFAFGASVLRLPGSTFLYGLLLVTLMVPLSALVSPLAVELNHIGWINTYPGLIFPYAALGVPFAVVILKAFMDEIPPDLLDAAAVDGAKPWRVFVQVVLPILRPALIFIAVWQFITSWNEFFLALVVMSNDATKTLPLVPAQYEGVYLGNPGALFAILVLIAAPLIVLYLLVQRWFVAGLMDGAVKG